MIASAFYGSLPTFTNPSLDTRLMIGYHCWPMVAMEFLYEKKDYGHHRSRNFGPREHSSGEALGRGTVRNAS